MIKEIIIVEGKDDVSAVKKAVDADIFTTSGLGLTKDMIAKIKKAAEGRGAIILTDPDYPGKKIRRILSEEIPNCKHAFIPRNKANKNGNIGVENSTPEDILEALKNAKAVHYDTVETFKKSDMFYYDLEGSPNASEMRKILGDELGIGFCSAKQFLQRLNSFGITKEDLEQALENVYKKK